VRRQIAFHRDVCPVLLHNFKDASTLPSIRTIPFSNLPRFTPHIPLSLIISFGGSQLSLSAYLSSPFWQKHAATPGWLSLKPKGLGVYSKHLAPECVEWTDHTPVYLRTAGEIWEPPQVSSVAHACGWAHIGVGRQQMRSTQLR
jgi:hypothetical protein